MVNAVISAGAPKRPFWSHRLVRRLRSHRFFALGLSILLVVLIAALAAHWIAPASPTEMLQLAPSHVTFELDSVATAQSLAGAQRMLHEEPQA